MIQLDKQLFSKPIAHMLERLARRVEQEVPATGDFEHILECFENPDESTQKYVAAYGLRFQAFDHDEDPACRYLTAEALESAGEYLQERIVGSGTNAELVAKLRSQEFAQRLLSVYESHLNDFIADY